MILTLKRKIFFLYPTVFILMIGWFFLGWPFSNPFLDNKIKSAQAAITLVPGSLSGGAYSGSGISLIAPTAVTANSAGNLLVLSISWFSALGNITSVSDTNGNNWKLASVVSDSIVGNNGGAAIYYVENCIAGDNSITVNFSNTVTEAYVAVSEFSGAAYSFALDQASGANQSANNALDAVISGLITPTEKDELVVGVAADIGASGAATNISGGTGFSPAVIMGGFNYEYGTRNNISPFRAAWTWDVTSVYVAAAATFRPVNGNNVLGYAWSSNAGWISMNCANTGTCAASNYGVKICDLTCPPSQVLNFQGYAWSPNAGWISFNETGAPDYGFSSYCKNTCNASTNCTACFNPDNGRVYGWAKVLNLGDDGWIKLGTTSSPFPDGVRIDQVDDPGSFYGWGWNGNSDPAKGLGWVSFNCANTGTCGTSNYRVYLSAANPPVPRDLSAPNWSTSSACATDISNNAILRWQFYDQDLASMQTAFQIIVSSSTSSSSPDSFHTGKISNSVSQYNLLANGVNHILDNAGSYYWWAKIWDNFGFASKWVQFNTSTPNHVLTDNVLENEASPFGNSKTFTVYSQDFPQPYFDWIPKDPITGETVTSTDRSFYYLGPLGGFVSCDDSLDNCSWVWSSPNALTNSTPNSSTTAMTLSGGANREIRLKVTDYMGYSCSTSTIFNIDLLPFWKETTFQP